MSLLKLAHVSAFYGPSQALFDVHLTIAPGEVLALMGRNGMGKIDHRQGDLPAAAQPRRVGAVRRAGSGACPATRPRAPASGWCPRGGAASPTLTVHENLIAAARPGPWTLARVGELFPGWASGRGRSRYRFRAANSRCWPSAGR